jgi:hypothetical protein
VQNTVSLSTRAVNRLADFWPVLASDNHSYQASLGGVRFCTQCWPSRLRMG